MFVRIYVHSINLPTIQIIWKFNVEFNVLEYFPFPHVLKGRKFSCVLQHYFLNVVTFLIMTLDSISLPSTRFLISKYRSFGVN